MSNDSEIRLLEEFVKELANDNLEQLGDNLTDEKIKEIFKEMSDLELGHFAGLGGATGALVCKDVNIESGALDGTCRMFDAAVSEYKNRQDSSPKR